LKVASVIKRYLPKSLLGRSLLIIVMPLVILQVVSGVIFYETHWDKVTLRLARGVAGDVGAVINLMRRHPGPDNHGWIFDVAAQYMQMEIGFRPEEVLDNAPVSYTSLMERMLSRALREYIGKPHRIDNESVDRHVVIDVQLPNGVLNVVTTRKRLFSSTAYVFVIWMVGTSLILFAVATIFMRNQVKPIRRLALAAENFGKGRDVSNFKPEGANEVRQAASAFIAMRDRILRQIGQRTEMLAGVSHDLRTPLTRMRLELEMIGNNVAARELKADAQEMEHMLDGYLAFARGEGTEQPQPSNLTAVLEDVVTQARRKGGAIDYHAEGRIEMPLRVNAFKRSITNLVDNAIRYAGHVTVRAGERSDSIEILVDDDGPGIPEDKRTDVFKPFYRIEASRNPGTGGVGLGLSIARDVIQGHGGTVELADSPNGGLRVRISLPI